MSKLLQNKRNDAISIANERCVCVSDNITIIPMYHTNDSLSYHVSRCNYCREEWAEYWISYRYVFSSLISQRQRELEAVMSL
jgi:aspartate carbamoyltransferase regulatory subunit